jgi:hypothetical protein
MSVGGALQLNLTRRSSQELRSYRLRRAPRTLDCCGGLRLEIGSVEQDHLASNPKLVSETLELIDVILGSYEPHNRYAKRKCEDARVVAGSGNWPHV